MVFSSHIFIFYFLPFAFSLYFLLPLRGKHIWLTLVSFVFYGWANPWFVLLMMFQISVDWVAGMTIANQWRCRGDQPVALLPRDQPRQRRQKIAVGVAVASNLCLLGFFKYFNFGLDTWNATLSAVGWESARWDTMLRITLPLGISFYTFQSMSYSIDVYRGHARAVRGILDYMCYVAMFPQLVAGPIVRFQDVAGQLITRRHSMEKFARGVTFFSLGMAKKILLANPCGKVADTVFDAAGVSVLDAWYGASAYAFQIYFDFSAYSDMAIGLGLMLGFVFAKNFDSPYRSRSITEFWRRWHISLSTWLRDNLYIPLGGNRKGAFRTYANLAVTMLLGGLWHGASWNFVIWGGVHGGMLAVERGRGKTSIYSRLPACLQTALTFAIILVTWVFFRAQDLASALSYIGNMFGVSGGHAGRDMAAGLIYKPYFLLLFLTAAVLVWRAPQVWDYTRRLTWGKAVFAAAMLLLSLAVMETQSFNPFIYFIF